MNIIIATNNMHKKDELKAILTGHSLFVPEDFSLDFDFEETEETFFGNALGKARALRALLPRELKEEGAAVLADDSGLVVPALGGEPGVFSARYGSDIFGRMLSSEERNDFLLKNMENIEERSAYFVCSMVVLADDVRMFAVQETFDGTIARTPTGTRGFGYDPLFYLPDYGQSAAELDAGQKNLLSHRGKAARALAALLS